MPGYLATKRLIRREIFKEKDLKTVTRETGSFSITNTVFNIIMPLPSLGGSDDQRIGDEIDVRSFEIE